MKTLNSKLKIQKSCFDFLVIGSGIAGLNFALEAAQYGTVAVVTKKELMESNSNYAQGGIAAVLDQSDSFEQHIEDTLKAGAYHNDKKTVAIMVREAPACIQELIRLGVGFNRDEGKLCLTQEGGHSQRRIANAKDTTGREIERALIHNVHHHDNIATFESSVAIDLLIHRGNCQGALVLHDETKKIAAFYARATILATGGAGQVYERNSNPKITTGDGIAMAHRAGADIRDMEFVQFHPTALAKKGKPAFLISETVRGEGGVLKHMRGKPFMAAYDPRGDLAPRDIVSRAVFSELTKGPVYLDIRHKGSAYIKHRFPYIYNELWWFGIKMDRQPIPVAPAAHFFCGGVHTDSFGRTSIPGLFAFGEVAHTGVHGANRLASNSLLECVVFSHRAARAAGKYISENQDHVALTQGKYKKSLSVARTIDPGIPKLRSTIQRLMWQHVGIVRKLHQLNVVHKKLVLFSLPIEKIFAQGISREIIELRNIHAVALLITRAAIARPESLGAHFIAQN